MYVSFLILQLRSIRILLELCASSSILNFCLKYYIDLCTSSSILYFSFQSPIELFLYHLRFFILGVNYSKNCVYPASPAQYGSDVHEYSCNEELCLHCVDRKNLVPCWNHQQDGQVLSCMLKIKLTSTYLKMVYYILNRMHIKLYPV